MTAALIAAHLSGQQREFERAAARGVAVPDAVDELADVSEFAELPPLVQDGVPILDPKEVLAFLRGKVPLNSRTIDSIIRQMRERGVTVTEEYRQSLLELLHEFIGRIHAERLDIKGKVGPLEQQVDQLDAMLREAGLDEANPRHLETIIRTHTNTAYTAGRLDALDTPELDEAFPYLLYRTVDDSAVRPSHRKMHEKAYPKKHPIWAKWTPPNGFNCRCSIVPATADDLKALGIRPSAVAPKDGSTRVEPDEGFRFNGAQAFRRGGLAGLDGRAAEAAREWIAARNPGTS